MHVRVTPPRVMPRPPAACAAPAAVAAARQSYTHRDGIKGQQTSDAASVREVAQPGQNRAPARVTLLMQMVPGAGAGLLLQRLTQASRACVRSGMSVSDCHCHQRYSARDIVAAASDTSTSAPDAAAASATGAATPLRDAACSISLQE